MPRKLVLDTNVFYNIGAGELALSDIQEDESEKICYSPLSTLELAAKWNLRTFEARRGAAKAILSTEARELPDTDTFLTRDIYGYPPRRQQLSLQHAVRAMADASTMAELSAGVPDHELQVTRRVSITRAAQYRSVTEQKWVRDLLNLQRDRIPRFREWYDPDPKKRNGSVPRLKGKARTTFLSEATSQDWSMRLIEACQKRAFLSAKLKGSLVPTRETVDRLVSATQAVSCYCAVYTQYLVRLITDGALPSPNDSTDIELFLHSTGENIIIVTSEKKWKAIADAAGFGARLRSV